MKDIKIERLTVKETSEVKGGFQIPTQPAFPSLGSPGGTSGCTGDNNCMCVCG